MKRHVKTLHTRRKRIVLVVSVLLLPLSFWMGGCALKSRMTEPAGLHAAETPSASKIEPEARMLFFQAERQYNARNFIEALKLYQQVKIRFPRGKAAVLASY